MRNKNSFKHETKKQRLFIGIDEEELLKRLNNPNRCLGTEIKIEDVKQPSQDK